MRFPRVVSWLLVAALLALLPTLTVSAQGRYGAQVQASYANCGLTQIFGQVFDAAGNPQTGVGIRLWWPDNTVRTVSGAKPDVGPAGWDFSLAPFAQANTWYLATEDSSGNLTSDPVAVTTTSHCTQSDSVNVVRLNFRQGGGSTPPPTSTPVPGITPTPDGTMQPAPSLTADAVCTSYSQAAGGRGSFRVCDDANARFRTAFNRYGLQNVGYPISQRFVRDGFITQAFQKAILQWRPESSTAAFVNVFDELKAAGYDFRLYTERQTPYQLPDGFDPPGATFEQIKQGRQALLNVRPRMRAAYFSVADPLLFFGLPTSEVTDMGNHYAVRMQRGVLQEWKETVPWAQAGQVTIANGADIAKEFGHLSGFALVPDGTPPATPSPTQGTQPPPPTPTPTQSGSEPPRNLDPRLPALGVGIAPANVAVGQQYWRVTEIIFHDDVEAQGRHALQMDAFNGDGSRAVGQTITVYWGNGSATVPIESKPAPDYGANYPMYHAGCSYNVYVNGYPSETVTCLGLGIPGPTRGWRTDHVEYLIKWQLVTKR